jgi:hypothetical protein
LSTADRNKAASSFLPSFLRSSSVSTNLVLLHLNWVKFSFFS